MSIQAFSWLAQVPEILSSDSLARESPTRNLVSSLCMNEVDIRYGINSY